MDPLTPKQQRVFDWIAEYIQSAGIAPTYEEIGAALGFRSISTVSSYVSLLEHRGWLIREFNRPRALRLTEPGTEAVRRVRGGQLPKGARYVRVEAIPALFEGWAREWLARRGTEPPAVGTLATYATRRVSA